jgi:hypothetical protein
MPPWACEQLGVTSSRAARALVVPSGRLLCALVRRVVPPTQRAGVT